LTAVDPLSAADGSSSAIGPPSAAAATDASKGRSCSAAANQTISKAALGIVGKLNYLRACMVRQLCFQFPCYIHLVCLPESRIETEICAVSFLRKSFCKKYARFINTFRDNLAENFGEN
jgi:hypothetical protein